MNDLDKCKAHPLGFCMTCGEPVQNVIGWIDNHMEQEHENEHI